MFSRQPALEPLEDRLTPAAPLVIHGTAGNDIVQVDDLGTILRVCRNGVCQFYWEANVSCIYFYGYAGNDKFVNNTGHCSYAYDHDGNDTLIGGWSTDYLNGGNGSDWLYGRTGNDTLVAGYDYSWNVLDGGDGNDWLYGGYGNDWLYGRNGNDRLYGSSGNDYLDGGAGWDFIDGGPGTDTAVNGEWVVNVP